MDIKTLIELSHSQAKKSGFWDKDRNKGELIALMHAELSELLEAIRNPNKTPEPSSKKYVGLETLPDAIFTESYRTHCKGTEGEELADLIIRVCDYVGGFGIDLESAIAAKMRYNSLRPKMHGKKF